MKRNALNRAVCACLAALFLLALAGCGGNDVPDVPVTEPTETKPIATEPVTEPAGDGIPQEAVISDPGVLESDVFYLYGVVKSGEQYYAKILTERRETVAEEEFRYLRLADTLTGYFQDPAWIGAWSPEQYLTAKALFDGYKAGVIASGAEFTCVFTDGYVTYLAEENYYRETEADAGLPDEYDLPVEELPALLPDVLQLREKEYGEMPVFTSQFEVTEYALWCFLWGKDGFECYLSRDLATDEGTGNAVVRGACDDMAAYFLFSAYSEWDMFAEDRGDEEGVYAKVKLIFEKPEWDREAQAEALEFVMKNPVPEGGFTDYRSERDYAKLIHDHLAEKVTYDPRGYDPNGLSGVDRYENKQEAYTSLGEDQDSTVCAGYARGFALIAHYAGINCAWVWGNETETESHAWNILFPCDGSEPVLIDVTWDDTDSTDLEAQPAVIYDWFYIPLSQVYDHTPDTDMAAFLGYLNQVEFAAG